MKSRHRIGLFLILTIGISFLLAGIYKLLGKGLNDRLEFTLLGAAYMFVPLISVVVVKKLVHKEKLSDLFISFKPNKWFLVAWLLMPLVAFCAFAISLLFPGITYSPDMAGMFKQFESIMNPEQIEQMRQSMETLPFDPIWITLIQGLIAGITINAVAGFGEELGWRGFLLKEFEDYSFFKASVVIGFIWGIWHAPMILMGHNYPQHPQFGVLMMTLWCILLSPIFIYLTLKSKSVIAAAILHGTLNATAGLSTMKIDGGSDLISGITGLAGFIALLLVIAVIFVYDNYISKERILLSRIRNHMA